MFLSGIAAIWGVVFPFEVIGDDMLQREFGYSANDAGFIIAAAPMVSILSPALVPFLGATLHQKLQAFRHSGEACQVVVSRGFQWLLVGLRRFSIKGFWWVLFFLKGFWWS